MRYIKIDLENINLLTNFIDNLVDGKEQFRYYNTRNVSVINNHIVTLVCVNNGIIVSYGHLDKEDDKVWLGICVADDEKNKGYGKKMMNELIRLSKELKIKEVCLTVDNGNTIAKSLYTNIGFKVDHVQKLITCYKIKL